MKKKSLCFVVAAVILAGSLAGCGRNDPKNTQAPVSTAGAGTEAGNYNLDKHLEISWTSMNCGDLEPNTFVQQALEKAMNISLTVRKVDWQNGEQINLMIASGEMPDAAWLGGIDRSDLYYEQKLTRPIPVSMIKEYAPAIAAEFDKNPFAWKMGQIKGDPDNLCQINATMNGGVQYLFADFYRLDWINNLGIELPMELNKIGDQLYISADPMPLDLFVDILEKFTFNDPDKNGQNDTYGMLGYASAPFGWSWYTLMRAFGLTSEWTMEENGKGIMFYSSEKYKDYLKYVQDVYSRGVIDREIFTLDRSLFFEKATNGAGGYFCAASNWVASWATTRPPLSLMEADPNAVMLLTPGIADKDGGFGTRIFDWGNLSYPLVFNANCSDEKLARILMMVEYVNFGPDRVFYAFGREDVDFDWEGEPGRSGAILREGVKTGGNTGINSFGSFNFQDEENVFWNLDSLYALIADYTVGPNSKWVPHLVYPYVIDPDDETGYKELIIQHDELITSIVTEFFADVVVDGLDVDSNWDAYIAKIMSAGYDKYLEAFSKMPKYADYIKIM